MYIYIKLIYKFINLKIFLIIGNKLYFEYDDDYIFDISLIDNQFIGEKIILIISVNGKSSLIY